MEIWFQATLMRTDRDTISLVKELDGLPLALSVAGAYLEHVTTCFADYCCLNSLLIG